MMFLATSRFPASGGGKAEADVVQTQAEVAIATDGKVGGGAYAANWDGETVVYPGKKSEQKVRGNDMAEKVWAHTIQAFAEIEAGKVFSG